MEGENYFSYLQMRSPMNLSAETPLISASSNGDWINFNPESSVSFCISPSTRVCSWNINNDITLKVQAIAMPIRITKLILNVTQKFQ